MGSGGWRYRRERPATGWSAGQHLYRLHDDFDRILFTEYVYKSETKHYVVVMWAWAESRYRRLLKGTDDVTSLYPSKRAAMDAYLAHTDREIRRADESLERKRGDRERIARLVEETRNALSD
jgi:hypothetical protein